MALFDSWKARKGRSRRRLGRPLMVERLEDRCAMSYVIHDLGTLSGDSAATAIDPDGDVAGWAVNSSGKTHAVLWDEDTLQLTDLATITGGTTSSASGVNNTQTVVGSADDAYHNTHAFLWTAGNGMMDLGTLIGTGQNSGTSTAMAINGAGTVAGKSNYSTQSSKFHAFRYDTSMHDLGTGTTGSYANAINNNSTPVLAGAQDGYVDPTYCGDTHYNHAYEWTGSSGQEVGTISNGEEAHAFGLNDDGLVVGDSSINHECGPMPTPHAFVAVPDATQTPPFDFTQLDANVSWIAQSRAYSITSGTSNYKVVGQWSGNASDVNMKFGFLWDGTMRNLDDLISGSNSGWSGLLAYAINDANQIVGQGLHNGSKRAFRMDPVTGPSTAGQEKTPPASASTAGPAPAALPPADCGCQARHATQLALAALTPAAPAPSGPASSAPVATDPATAPVILPQDLIVSVSTNSTASGAALPAVQDPTATDAFFTAPGLGPTALWAANETGGLPAPLA